MPPSTPRASNSPSRVLARAIETRVWWTPLLGATLAALVFAAVASPRVDYEGAAAEALDRAGVSGQLSPHDREAALGTARRVGALAAYLGAGLGTPVAALGAALGLWLAFRVVGGRPDVSATATVASLGLLPGAAKNLLSIPALLSRRSLTPWETERLLPASPGALLPAGTDSPLASLLWSFDLFSVSAVVLVAWGMASAAGVSPRRSLVTCAMLWLGYVAAFKVALPVFGGLH